MSYKLYIETAFVISISECSAKVGKCQQLYEWATIIMGILFATQMNATTTTTKMILQKCNILVGNVSKYTNEKAVFLDCIIEKWFFFKETRRKSSYCCCKSMFIGSDDLPFPLHPALAFWYSPIGFCTRKTKLWM